jgi:hypothetical protein
MLEGIGLNRSAHPARSAVMHPMFVKLFLEADADDLVAEEEDKRRASNRSRRRRSRVAAKTTVRDRGRRPPR